MKKQYLILLVIHLGIFNVWAQKDTKLEADKAYDKLSYLKAADLYQELGESGLDEVAKIKLADSYRLNGDTETAEYWYAQAVTETTNPEDILHFAQVLQSNGKCEKALEWYNQYRALMGAEHALPRAEITDCDHLIFESKQPVVVSNARQLNSGHLDYSPVPYRGGIVFTSTRGQTENVVEDSWTKDNFSDLFYAKKTGDQDFSSIEALKGDINGNYHDGAATFNKAGTVMYFSRNNQTGKNSKEEVDLKIYKAELNNKRWGKVTELPFNDGEFATCHPTLSEDGTTMYFASNRPGGFGGMDLYKSVRSGTYWSVPENLGAAINTAGNEIFPFIDKKGTLYYSSNGLPGIGGLDIYQTTLVDGEWLPAENMGEPINSSKDDFGYCVLSNGTEGYFTSNRTGGYGGDDLYFWSATKLPQTIPQNIIAVVDENTGSRISEALVTVVEGIYKNKQTIPSGRPEKNDDLIPSEYWAQAISFFTDVKGTIQPAIRRGKTYTIFIEKVGYTPVKKVVNSYELIRTPEWIVPLRKREGLVLNGALIHKEYNRAIPNAELALFSFCTGEYEKTVSDDKGNFAFFLDCNCDYEIIAQKDRFNPNKEQYSTLGLDCNTEKSMNTTLYLEANKPTPVTKTEPPKATSPNPAPVVETLKVGKVIELEDVYYDFNQATIRGDASKSLDKLILILNQYPSLEIQLLSHTDARGDKVYNEYLSQKRAEAAVQYMVERGIASSRISGKGYGEWLLKNECEDGTPCEEWQHQENRRTEVKITKLAKNVQVKYRRQ